MTGTTSTAILATSVGAALVLISFLGRIVTELDRNWLAKNGFAETKLSALLSRLQEHAPNHYRRSVFSADRGAQRHHLQDRQLLLPKCRGPKGSHPGNHRPPLEV